jgi:hypothetical protein
MQCPPNIDEPFPGTATVQYCILAVQQSNTVRDYAAAALAEGA